MRSVSWHLLRNSRSKTSGKLMAIKLARLAMQSECSALKLKKMVSGLGEAAELAKRSALGLTNLATRSEE